MSTKVDVLVVMRHSVSALHGAADDGADTRRYAESLHEAKEAVAELIEADNEYDAAHRSEADTAGMLRREAARARRKAALARVGSAA